MNIFTPPNFVPFEGITGKWVSSQEYKMKAKTFGYYQCNYCQKSWMSAHAQKGFKQGCKSCKRNFYAQFYW
jgi:hypothetical protein